MSNRYLMSENAKRGVVLITASGSSEFAIAAGSSDPIRGILARDTDEGMAADFYAPNDGAGEVYALCGGSITAADIGKHWTSDSQGRVVVLSASGWAGGVIAGTGSAGGGVRVVVQPSYVKLT